MSVREQQINLFQPLFYKEVKWLSAGRLLWACAAVVAVYLLIALQSLWTLTMDRVELQNLQQEFQIKQEHLQEINNKMLEKVEAINELRQIEAQLSLRQSLLDQLKNESANVEGFTPLFDALARQQQQGLWLTAVKFAGGGTQIVLEGKALNPAQVPEFIQRLAKEQLFKGKSFGIMQLFRENRADTTLGFQLGTAQAAPVAAGGKP